MSSRLSEAELVRAAAAKASNPDWLDAPDVVRPFGDERDQQVETAVLSEMAGNGQVDIGSTSDATDLSVWSPINDVVTGAWKAPQAGLVARSDGQGLLYPGEIHWLSGEPGAGKGWVATYTACEVMEAGGSVVYLDYESTANAIVERLRRIGVADDTITARFWHATWGSFADLEPRMLDEGWPTLVIVDAVAGAMALQGLDPDNNAATEEFVQRFLRPFALGAAWSSDAKPGAAVLAIDHVTKSRKQRSKWAIGAQRKLAAPSVAYLVEAVRPIEPHRADGKLKISLAKDRHGDIQAASIGSRMPKLVGEFHVDASRAGQPMICEIRTPSEGVSGDRSAERIREALRAFLADNPGANTRQVRKAAKGGKDAVDATVADLIASGVVTTRPGSHNSILHYLAEAATGVEVT